MREFLSGNEAVVRGALRAGCDFFAGYPITPASSILSEFVAAFSDNGGRAVQTEDEIAAIGQCIGAAMAGAKALTASSGPGLSLYSENIGLALMGEVPLVIINCQRMGPATGGATATGEGDVLFARHVTSGGYPLPVFSATDAASAYWLTYEAFNVAERFRTPVIVLTSKDIAMTRQTADLDAIELSTLVQRPRAASHQPYRPYHVDQPSDAPLFAPIGGPQRVRFTGSIHDEEGVLTIDRTKIERKLAHLVDKITKHRDELECVDEDLDPNADVLVIAYGTCEGAVRDAIEAGKAEGRRVSRLTLYSLWPVPENAIRRAVTSQVRKVIVPELNPGLYVDEVRKIITGCEVASLVRFDGGFIHPKTILGAMTAGYAK